MEKPIACNCGGSAYPSQSKGYWFVHCSQCCDQFPAAESGGSPHKQDAIESWNMWKTDIRRVTYTVTIRNAEGSILHRFNSEDQLTYFPTAASFEVEVKVDRNKEHKSTVRVKPLKLA